MLYGSDAAGGTLNAFTKFADFESEDDGEADIIAKIPVAPNSNNSTTTGGSDGYIYGVAQTASAM